MGLAVLPPRLKEELAEIEEFLLGNAHNVAAPHLEWAEQLKAQYGVLALREDVEVLLQKELGRKFVRVLEDAGVLKETAAFERFISTLNKQGVCP